MPIPLTYPGVYIEEVPSGVRTITGVPTSVAAFVGPAVRGAVDEPQTLFSFADFTNVFGGLDARYPLSYAVRDFFTNGGGQAVVVRIAKQGVGATTCGTFRIPVTGSPGEYLTLTARNPGKWPDTMYVQVNRKGLDAIAPESPASPPESEEPASLFPPLEFNRDLFNLKLGRALNQDRTEVIDIVEEYHNLTFNKECSRDIRRVLKAESQYLTIAAEGHIPTSTPDMLGTGPITGEPGDDGAINSEGHSLLEEGDYFGESDGSKIGIKALDKTDIFNLLCLPVRVGDEVSKGIIAAAATYCVGRRAMLILDPPAEWGNATPLPSLSVSPFISGPAARNVAAYYPRLMQSNPLKGGAIEEFVPCGAIAGLFSATDSARGVWKAPAGVDAALTGIDSLSRVMSDDENGLLNPLGINCLRTFAVIGTVVWGARTARGADQLADEYKYVPVRRTALFIEESLYRGTKWVVFEPNDERLWAQVRLNVGAFMHDLYRQGAFQGTSAQEAYFVKCDKETTLQNDIDRGILNILVGFAPLKPAEFVVIKLQQMAGQIAV